MTGQPVLDHPDRSRPAPMRILVAGVLTLLLGAALGGSAAGGGAPPARVQDPVLELVRGYLQTLQAGDATTARGYAAAAHGLAGGADDLLVAAAMDTRWQVTELARRHHPQADQATVDVELTAADGTAERGRFELERRSGGWVILNPLVWVDFSQLPITFVEINGVQTTAPRVWLFPGAYHTFGSVRDLIRIAAPTFVVAPGARSYSALAPEGTPRPPAPASRASYQPLVELTDAGLAAVHQRLRDWFDQCTGTGQPFPDNCPFAAGDPHDHTTLHIGRSEYRAATVEDLSWQVGSYPRLRLSQSQGSFIAQLVAPGRLRVSGIGTARYTDRRESFRGPCIVTLPGLQVTLAPPRTFTLIPDKTRSEPTCDTSQYLY